MKTTVSKKTMEEQLAALSALPDDEIDVSDIPEFTDGEWARSVRGQFHRPIKQRLTVNIDTDIVDWLKEQDTGSKGYRFRLNQILRAAMVASTNKYSAPENSFL